MGKYLALAMSSIALASCSAEGGPVFGPEFPQRGTYASQSTEMDVELPSSEAFIDISSEDDLRRFVLSKVFSDNCDDTPIELDGNSFKSVWSCRLQGPQSYPVDVSVQWARDFLQIRTDYEVSGYPLWHERSYRLIEAQ